MSPATSSKRTRTLSLTSKRRGLDLRMPDKGPPGDMRWMRRESQNQAPTINTHGKRLIMS